MQRALGTAAALSALLAPAPALAGSQPKPPTQAQITAAIKSAKHSKDLWATVNICHRPRFGIRGQMPALGFAAKLSMKIQIDYYNFVKKRFQPLRGTTSVVTFGSQTKDLHQGGSVWRFKPPAILSGTVTFKWRLGTKVIGTAVRKTAHGVKGVDDTDPKGNSTATCRFL
jgi:hypothetical protein